MIAVVAQGADPTDFGNLDLVDVLESTLGAVTPGRFSDHDDCVRHRLFDVRATTPTRSGQALDGHCPRPCHGVRAAGGRRLPPRPAVRRRWLPLRARCRWRPTARATPTHRLRGTGARRRSLGADDPDAEPTLGLPRRPPGLPTAASLKQGGPVQRQHRGRRGPGLRGSGRSDELTAAQDFLAEPPVRLLVRRRPCAGGIAFTAAEFASSRPRAGASARSPTRRCARPRRPPSGWPATRCSPSRPRAPRPPRRP